MDSRDQHRLEVAQSLPPGTPWYLWLSVAVVGTAVFGYWTLAAPKHPNAHLRALQDPLLLPAIFVFLAALVALVHQIRGLLGWRDRTSLDAHGSLGERAYQIAQRISAGGLGAADRKHSWAALQSTVNDLNREYADRLFYVAASAMVVLLTSVLAFSWRTIDQSQLVPLNYQAILIGGVALGSLLYVPAAFLSVAGRGVTRHWHSQAAQHAGLQHSAEPAADVDEAAPKPANELPDPFATLFPQQLTEPDDDVIDLPDSDQPGIPFADGSDDLSNPFVNGGEGNEGKHQAAAGGFGEEQSTWQEEEEKWDGFGGEETDPFGQFGS